MYSVIYKAVERKTGKIVVAKVTKTNEEMLLGESE